MNTNTSIAPIACQPWCEDGDGHPDAFHPDDQMCLSPSNLIPLSMEVPASPELSESVLDVFLQNDPVTGLSVNVAQDEERGVYLTIGEAERLRDALTALLQQV